MLPKVTPVQHAMWCSVVGAVAAPTFRPKQYAACVGCQQYMRHVLQFCLKLVKCHKLHRAHLCRVVCEGTKLLGVYIIVGGHAVKCCVLRVMTARAEYVVINTLNCHIPT